MKINKKGFTLIELLVVIAIIGILATIGLVALNGAREKARDATRKSDLSMLKTALVLYSDDEDSTYPGPSCTSGEAGAGKTMIGCIFNNVQVSENPVWDQYLSTALDDPQHAAGRVYEYDVCSIPPGSNNGFRLYTILEAPGSGGPYYWYITADGRSGDGETILPPCVPV